MPEDVTKELGRVARGGAIALVGLMISAVFGFLVRALVGRVYGPKQYGAYNLAFTVFTVTLTVVMLGFPIGLQREISYFRAKRPHEVGRLISTAISIILITSLLSLIFLEAIRGILPNYIGGGSLLSELLGILALGIPFSALFMVLVSVTQGFKRVREFMFYSKIFVPSFYFILAIVVALLIRGTLRIIILCYIVAQITGLGLLTNDLRRFNILPTKAEFSLTLAKVLVMFSLPLLLSGIVGFIMSWTDTLMLGHYLGSKIVGIYNAAAPLSRFIPVFLASFTVIYSPIVTNLYAQGKIEEIGEFYSSVTKWVVLLTFPLFLLLAAFPKPTIITLFGAKYVDAWAPLVILSLGFMFHTVVGPNGLTLVSLGRPTQELIGNIIGATLNVIINILLIPQYGMIGAAIATATSYVVANTYKSLILAKLHLIPFTKNYGKVLILAVMAFVAVKMLIHTSSFLMALLWVILTSTVFYVGTIAIGSFDGNDVELLRMASRKFGVNLNFIISVIEKFSK